MDFLDTNRASLISHSGCITKLKSLLLEYTTDQPDTVLADFAIKIFFNLCNDSGKQTQSPEMCVCVRPD